MKLARRSPRELWGRAAQAGHAALERAGWLPSVQLPPSTPLAPRLPFPRPDREGLTRVYAQRPREREALLERARAICGGRFPLLGYAGLSFGNPVDWHLDPVRQRRAPLLHWSRVPYLDAEQVGDHKVIWELNRQQWLVTLAQAWQLTGDPEYCRAAERYLTEWLAANPPKQGINWASSLELAFRSIAWTWCLFLLQDAPAPGGALRRKLAESLALQGDHIERYLSTWFSPNTHLTGEALGLLYLGSAWPDWPAAGRWSRIGWSILIEQAPIQVYEDGSYFEQTSWYQAYTVDFLLHARVLAQHAGLGVPGSFDVRLAGAAQLLRDLTRNDGSLPLIGDDDGGRLLPLGPDATRNFSDTLALAAWELERPELGPAEPPAALAWISGTASWLSQGAAEPPVRSAGYRDGGWYFLRAGTGNVLLLDAGPHGALACGHSHADALAVTLDLGHQPVLVDAGTFSYVGPERDAFRGAAAHNTLLLDGGGSAEPGTPFRWRSAPKVGCDTCILGDGFDYLEAWHDGFGGRFPGVRHVRAVLRLGASGWLLLDTLRGPCTALTAQLRFHLAPGLQVQQDTLHASRLDAPGLEARLATDGCGTLTQERSWVSACYGERSEALVLVRSVPAPSLSDGVATLLAPGLGSHPDPLRRLEAEGGSAWRWELGEQFAIVLLKHPDRPSVRCGDFESSAPAACFVLAAEGHPVRSIALGEGELRGGGARRSPVRSS